MNINVELMSGTACPLEVQQDQTIRELKEMVKEACWWTWLWVC